ncbi:MAG: AAC(3) family N-acetyltransferase [Oscillospiraceae bacterium]|nr:AAC(3) family N-acetyltransferase [Oscillospiraceae bacterium]
MAVVTKQDIKNTLTQLGIKEGDTVVFHSSLKSMGTVEGGARTVIDAFLEQVGPEGTVSVPTLLGESYSIAFDIWERDTTPSEVGYITEVFRTMPGTLRSDNPTHSLAARGKLAHALTCEHDGYGPRPGAFGPWAFSHSSPWQKLYDYDGKIVWVGTSTLTGTHRHLAEYVAAEKVVEKHPEALAVLTAYNDPRQHTFFPSLKWRLKDSICECLFRDRGQLLSAPCGSATFQTIDVRTFVDTLLELILNEPTVYTDVTDPEWIQWLLDVDDCSMTVWPKEQ